MILRTIRHLTRPLHQPSSGSIIPYNMFDAEATAAELKSAYKMEHIYHKGQAKAWDGKAVLEELVEKHGGVNIAPERLVPLRNIFAVIFWGELAAWKVASELALSLEPLEAKMAASSQAHDEARHFYVMHDYLELLGYTPSDLPGPAHRILHEVLTADSLAKKIVGMHLMVEPIALTLFQLVRENKLEPVLCDLLAFYERDEARHVALGVHFLPKLIAKMNRRELIDFYLWQLRMFMHQLDGVAAMEDDFHALGFSPRDVVRLGQIKQLHAGRLVAKQMGEKFPAEALMTRAVEFRLSLDYPDSPDATRIQRWRDACMALVGKSGNTQDLESELNTLGDGDVFGPMFAA